MVPQSSTIGLPGQSFFETPWFLIWSHFWNPRGPREATVTLFFSAGHAKVDDFPLSPEEAVRVVERYWILLAFLRSLRGPVQEILTPTGMKPKTAKKPRPGPQNDMVSYFLKKLEDLTPNGGVPYQT